MQSTSLNQSDRLVDLEVYATDEGVEISVADGSRRLAEKGIDFVAASLPPGIYKITAKFSRQNWEKMILLQDDLVRINIPAFVTKSVAPDRGALFSRETHNEFAYRVSEGIDDSYGVGAQIFLMVRNWSLDGSASAFQSYPWIERWRGETLAALGQIGEVHNKGDAVAAFNIKVNPGAYVLSLPSPTGPISQSVPAVENWRTEVYVLNDYSEPRKSSSRCEVSIRMSRSDSEFGSGRAAVYEAARKSVADEQAVISKKVLTELADGKFNNPLMGVLAAHILLIARDHAKERNTELESERDHRFIVPTRSPVPIEFDQDYYNLIVGNSAALLGQTNPDIIALKTQTSQGLVRQIQVPAPPLFRRSWKLLLRASIDRPDLISSGLWRRVRGALNSNPYFCWRRAASSAAEQVRVSELQLTQMVSAMQRQRTGKEFFTEPVSIHSPERVSTDANSGKKPSLDELALWGAALRNPQVQVTQGNEVVSPNLIDQAATRDRLVAETLERNIPGGVLARMAPNFVKKIDE